MRKENIEVNKPNILLKVVGRSSQLQQTLNQWLKDTRKLFKIPLTTIVLTFILRPFFGCESINQLDHFLKTTKAKTLFGCVKRTMVASATTIRRIFLMLLPNQFKKGLLSFVKYLYSIGALKGVKEHIIACVDGSCFGNNFAVCFYIASGCSAMVNFKTYKKRGKELKAAYKLIKETLHLLADSCIQIHLLCTDALYFNIKFFNLCIEHDIHPFVVYTYKKKSDCDKRYRTIIEEADRIFDSKIYQKDVKCKRYEDRVRKQLVEIKCAKGFEMRGVSKPLNVIRIRERDIKTNTHIKTTYIITTYNFTEEEREGVLSLIQARELSKGDGRWSIEIDGFRNLNQLFDSKREFTRGNRRRFENYLIGIFFSYNVLALYIFFEKKDMPYREYRQGKKYKTKKRILQIIIWEEVVANNISICGEMDCVANSG